MNNYVIVDKCPLCGENTDSPFIDNICSRCKLKDKVKGENK
jgi:NMD protein affecting ribosome stability and mRNA decay